MFKRRVSLKRKGSESTISTASSVTGALETDSASGIVGSGGYTVNVRNIKKELPYKLHRAVWKNNDEKLAHLIEEKDRKGIPKHSLLAVDKRKRSALHLAACGQNLRIVDLLLTRDGSSALLMQDDEGNTPLHKSIECDKYVVTMRFEKIRSCKDAANMKNNKGYTPLHLAAQRDDKKGGEKLLDAGAFVDHRDNEGNTPLALAVIHNSLQFVDLMNKEDATVDSTNDKGETPLILAVHCGNLEMVKKLLSFRMINPELKDNLNKSALDYAKELESNEICNELNEWQKNITNPPPSLPPYQSTATTNKKAGLSVIERAQEREEEEEEETLTQSKREDSVNTFSDIDISTPVHKNDVVDFHQLLREKNISGFYDPDEEDDEDSKDQDDEMKRGNVKSRTTDNHESTIHVSTVGGASLPQGPSAPSVTDPKHRPLITEASLPTSSALTQAKDSPERSISPIQDVIIAPVTTNNTGQRDTAAEEGWDSGEDTIIKSDEKKVKEDIPHKTIQSIATTQAEDINNPDNGGDDTDPSDDEQITQTPPVKQDSKQKGSDMKELLEEGWDDSDDDDGSTSDDESLEPSGYNPTAMVSKRVALPTLKPKEVQKGPTTVDTKAFDEVSSSVEKSKLSHPTATRPKPQNRHPPQKFTQPVSAELTPTRSSKPESISTPQSTAERNDSAGTITAQPRQDDLLMLVEEGWDSSDSEEDGETSHEETMPPPPTVQKTAMSTKNNTVVSSMKQKSDVEELLAGGWDSDVDSENETAVHQHTKSPKQANQPVTSPAAVVTSPTTTMTSPAAAVTLSPVVVTSSSSKPVINPSPAFTSSQPTRTITTSPSMTTETQKIHKTPLSSIGVRVLPPSRMPQFNTVLNVSSTDDDTTSEGEADEDHSAAVTGGGGTSYLHETTGTKLSLPNSLYTSVLTANSNPTDFAAKSSPLSSHKLPSKREDIPVVGRILSPVFSSNDDESAVGLPSEQHQTTYSLRKYEDVCEEKRRIEKIKMDQEVEIRRLEYKLEQMEEEIKLNNEEKEKLTEQICESEKRITAELREKEAIVLACKESEIQKKTLMVSLQQKEEEQENFKTLLLSEREENSLKTTSISQQQQRYQSLKSEAEATSEHRDQLSKQLKASDEQNKSLEDKVIKLEELLATKNEQLANALEDKQRLFADIDSAEERVAQAESNLTEEKNKSAARLQEKHSLELRVQELEIKQETLVASKDKLLAELKETRKQLKTEQEGMTDKEAELQNRDEQHRSLREEIKKITEDNTRLSTLLDSSNQSKLTLESKISDLENQLKNLNSRLTTEHSERLQTLKDVGEANRRAEERKEFFEEEKTKHQIIVEGLKDDLRKAESDCSSKADQIMSLKDKLASNKTSKALLEKDIQELKRELSSSLDVNGQLQERIEAIDQAYSELDKEKGRLEDVIGRMTLEASTKQHELEETHRVAKKYQEVVEKAHETLTLTARERDEAVAGKADLQSQIIEFEGKVNSILIELNQHEQKEKNLLNELEQLRKSRSSIQDLATKLRGENVSLEHQLADEHVQRERAEAENKELKEIWESEVKAKHKLTDKIMELELIQKEADGSANQERRKIKKIIEQKEILQLKIDSLQEKNGQLQRENGEYKATLREARKQLKMMESSKHLDELNRSKLVDSSEVIPLHTKITTLQEQLKHETERRLTAEDKSRQLEYELKLTQKMLEDAKQEMNDVSGRRRREERKIASLTEELNTLQDHLSQLTVPKEQYEAVSSELKESNFENERMAKDVSDAKYKLKTLLADVDHLKMEKASAVTEALRYKELYEKEMVKRDNLTTKLDNARTKMAYSKSRLKMERLDTERLLQETRKKYSQQTSRFTSTPRAYEPRTSPVDEDMLADVRSRLDRSIASHRDSTLTYSMLGTSSYTVDNKESHLDSIKRQYRL